jgi:hypothetical protein
MIQPVIAVHSTCKKYTEKAQKSEEIFEEILRFKKSYAFFCIKKTNMLA